MNSVFVIKQLTSLQWQSLLPIIILSVTGITTLLTCTLKSAKSYLINFFVFSLGLTGAAIAFVFFSPESSILDGTILIDGYTKIFAVIMIIATLLISLVEFQTPKDVRLPSELYSLLCFCLVGAIILSSSTDLMMIFIALELMTFSVYVMVAMNRTSKLSAEAALKYFILGGVASGILLYGITLIFGTTGSFNLQSLGTILSSAPEFNQVLAFGILFFFLGIFFKVGSSPLHVWVPDVYTGAANTVTSFMMTVIKFASFCFLIRVILSLGSNELFRYQPKMFYLFAAGSALSLLGGNLVGLLQHDFKRLISYSSIGHTGFLLVGFTSVMASEGQNFGPIINYLIYYVVGSIGLMAIVNLVNPDNTHSFELKDFSGLYVKSPFLAISATIFLLSLAGFPPLAGFFGKYFIIIEALSSQQNILAIIAILSSVVGMVMYLRPIKYIFFRVEVEKNQGNRIEATSFLTIFICLGLTFVLPYVL